MKFRYARHTNNLKVLSEFYTNVLGLEKLGGFKNHSNYNGVFLGLPNKDWHIEFTESDEKAEHNPDEDDLLVFYMSIVEMDTVRSNIEKYKVPSVKSKNPYWQEHGIEVKDPDGFGVVIALI